MAMRGNCCVVDDLWCFRFRFRFCFCCRLCRFWPFAEASLTLENPSPPRVFIFAGVLVLLTHCCRRWAQSEVEIPYPDKYHE